jgi:hypothetical protein
VFDIGLPRLAAGGSFPLYLMARVQSACTV